ncbi:flagellar hook-associated protein FlgK [Motiliproteus sp.]|uniref:flagellar hook-associated protein FlgK n=1 Tax=Motiliproteus sp. TaxID=1898955 RepID=UPI003BA8F2C8
MTINIALQGLSVAQRGFEVASNNIANVNTPGYSRQQIDLSSRAAPEQGVQILSINRVVDLFSQQQHWSSSAAFQSSDAFAFYAGQLDNLLANSNTSLSASLDQFFSALQTGVDDPSSIPNRELILAQADATAERFVEVDRQLRAQNDAVNTKLNSATDEVNQMAKIVADLNDLIRLADSRGEPANELKDQRDQMIMGLSEKLGVTVQTSTGSTDINLYVGNGQPLVIGGNASTVTYSQGDPDINDVDIHLSINDKRIKIDDQINDGEIGGLLRIKDELLIPSWNELGRLAIVFSDTMNEQHIKGVDIDGRMANELFSDLKTTGEVRAFSTNQSPMSSLSDVVIRDTSLLNASDYVVKFGEGNSFTVTRKSDGQIFTQNDFTARNGALAADSYQDMTLDQDVANGTLRLNIDGIDIDLRTAKGEAFGENDQVLIMPVRTGAESLSVELKSGRELAFASPVRAETAEDNLGTLSVDGIIIQEPTNFGQQGSAVSMELALVNNPPVQIVFNADGTYNAFDVSDPNNPIAYVFDDGSAATNRTYTEGQPIQFNGFTATVSGKPSVNDKIDFSPNTGAVSDNRNALQLSNLQQAEVIEGATYQDNYGRLIERVGTSASVANINLQANETIMRNAEAVRNGISGVNLDEEAADIIKFQQQYQAAAQVINTARSLFDTLLASTGG